MTPLESSIRQANRARRLEMERTSIEARRIAWANR